MILNKYKLTSYTDFLPQLAASFNTTVAYNMLLIPPQYGAGYFHVSELSNGLQALTYDFVLKEDLVLQRQKDEHAEYYTLVLDSFENNTGFAISIGSEQTSAKVERSNLFYLSSFLYNVESILYKNVHVQGIRIFLTAAWMHKYLQLKENENVLEKYINLKSAGIWYKPVDEEIKNLLQDILKGVNDPLLFHENKIFRLVVLFFEWLYDEMKIISDKSGISRNDIERAQKVENILTVDVTKIPPTVKELAREVNMSESKLKKIFKAVYGLPPYEYFQIKRMHKAKIMLLSGNYSVKDIGYTLGYANLSNFTLAFKKVFAQLPSEVLKSNAK